MVQARHVEQQRIAQHARRALAPRRGQVIGWFMIERGGFEQAGLAVADGTGGHAVVATDTGCEQAG